MVWEEGKAPRRSPRRDTGRKHANSSKARLHVEPVTLALHTAAATLSNIKIHATLISAHILYGTGMECVLVPTVTAAERSSEHD